MEQRHFQVRPSFVVTVIKCQGQTHKNIGVWLEQPTFKHGQLYVATSRVEDRQNFNFAVNKSVSRKTRNVVYREIQSACDIVSTPTEVPSICSLLNSDQPKVGVEE